jgi:hypothetical protein
MVSLAQAAEVARAHLLTDDGQLWGTSLAGVEWMGIDGDSIQLTADPGVAGYEPAGDGVWAGPLPAAIAMASAAQDWADRTWAVVMFPLYDDLDKTVRFLVHEAFHVVQSRVFPEALSTETAEGMELLDNAEGRVWLRMEVAALAAALESAGEERLAAAGDALLFRYRRLATATAAEAVRERDLDIREGTAEYTAWRLTGATPSQVAGQARSLPAERSWVRGFAYHTGPAYGFLLDALQPGWQSGVVRRPDLQAELASALAEARGAAYGLNDAGLAEQEREALHQERVDRLRQAYAAGPLLRLPLAGHPISFNPYDVVPLDDGVFRGNVAWRNEDGSVLDAPGGAVVAPDFSEVRLLCAEPPEVPGTTTGEGWTLRLAEGWTAEAVEGGWKILRQQPG